MSQKTVVVIGSNGQLGADICKSLVDWDVVPLTHNDIEVSEIESCRKILDFSSVYAIVNTSAYHQVDKCESDPITSYKVNAIGPRNLSYISNEMSSYLIHISTDYVFDGEKKSPYIETDIPTPLNVYGNTKLSGEFFIRSIAKNFLIIRTSALYGKSPCRAKGLNFVDKMLDLAKKRNEIKVVDNEFVTPTSTECLSNQISILLKHNVMGICHATCEGECSWYQFARKIYDIAKVKVNLKVANPDEFPIKVRRPLYSVLENSYLKECKLNIMPEWEKSLEYYLASRCNS